MGFTHLAWASDKSGVPTNRHWSVLTYLASCASDDGTCYPGQETIARVTRLSVRSVRGALKDLEDWGLITREYRRRSSDNMRTSDGYVLHVDKSYRQEVPVTIESPAKNVTESPANDSASHRQITHESPARAAGQEQPVHNSQYEQQGLAQPAKIAGSPRGTRVPEDFPVSAAMREWAGANAPSANVDVETAKFVDHWKAAPGAKGVKSDWLAAWRNWLRIAHGWNVERGWKAPEPIHRFGRGHDDAA